MTIYILCILIGIVAGLRAMTAVAAVSWAAAVGDLQLGQTWLAFLGYRWTPYILTLLALGELGTDKLPSSPSRTVPIQLGARILASALSGAAIGATHDALLIGPHLESLALSSVRTAAQRFATSLLRLSGATYLQGF